MLPHICHCCGGRIAASDQGRGMLICKDCEQLTTDDSPQVSALTLEALAVEPEPPSPAPAPVGPRRPPALARQETPTTG